MMLSFPALQMKILNLDAQKTKKRARIGKCQCYDIRIKIFAWLTSLGKVNTKLNNLTSRLH